LFNWPERTHCSHKISIQNVSVRKHRLDSDYQKTFLCTNQLHKFDGTRATRLANEISSVRIL